MTDLKECLDYPGYFVSSKGVIFSRRRGVLYQMKTQYNCRSGYASVTATVKSKRKGLSVHREVAKAFLENFNKKPQVNHKDGNKENNQVENLEWCTISENSLHTSRVLGLNIGEKHPSAKYSENIIKEVKKLLSAKVSPKEIYSLTGVKVNTIYGLKQGKWRHLDAVTDV